MILHVYDLATKSNVGDVLVATPDKIIFDLIKKNGGNSFFQRIIRLEPIGFWGLKKFYLSEPEIIINLQGDMPNLNPNDIIKLRDYLKEKCHIGTLHRI